MTGHMARKFGRFLTMIILSALATAFILMAAVPHVGQVGIVVASVLVALLVSLYDLGLFAEEFEI